LDEFFIGNKNGKEKFPGMLIRVKGNFKGLVFLRQKGHSVEQPFCNK
jgi:hypothetical protein